MLRIAIHDANILIDLVKTGLFGYCLELEYEFTSTDIIVDELWPEQIALIEPHSSSGKFNIIKITETELVAIQLLSKEDIRLSEQDWSALYFAQKYQAILVTGDKHMRRIAKEKSVEFHGIFWLLDQLVRTAILSRAEACEFLDKLMQINKRLPAEECEKRMQLWRKS